MDPATMAAVSIGTTLLSGGVGIAGASGSASASANSFNYKAGIASLNQTIAKQNEAWAINSGGIKAVNYGLKAGEAIAETKAKQGASGIDVNSGSPDAVRDTQHDVAKYDQNMIRADAQHQAYGYEVEGAKYKAEEGMDRAAANDATNAGRLNVLSSVIGTASSVASKWTQGNTLGIWGGKSGSVGSFSNGGNDGLAPSWSN